MTRITAFPGRAAALAALLLALPVAGCAPQQTGSTIGAGQLGRAASVSYGTIVGMRPVQVVGQRGPGVGTVAGAAAGGVAGSFIGGDWRSNALAGIGGALLKIAPGEILTEQNGYIFMLRCE